MSAVASAVCARAESECSLGRSGDAVASVRRAVDLLLAIDQDAAWAPAILGWALIESPAPVSEAGDPQAAEEARRAAGLYEATGYAAEAAEAAEAEALLQALAVARG